jgi:hypothetical protein
MSAQKIPITFIPWPGAMDVGETAAYISASRATVYRLKNLPKSNPRRLRFTSYGKCPVFEADRHLRAELERA